MILPGAPQTHRLALLKSYKKIQQKLWVIFLSTKQTFWKNMKLGQVWPGRLKRGHVSLKTVIQVHRWNCLGLCFDLNMDTNKHKAFRIAIFRLYSQNTNPFVFQESSLALKHNQSLSDEMRSICLDRVVNIWCLVAILHLSSHDIRNGNTL